MQSDAGQAAEPERGAAPSPRAAAEYYPGRLLVLADQDAGEERVPRHRAGRQRHLAEHEDARRDWIRNVKIGRLHGVPSARHQGHARDPARRSARSIRPTAAWDRRVQSGQAGAQMSGGAQPAWAAARADDVRRLDRSRSRRANCRRRRRGRRASSATSSSRSGTGPIRRRTCTTWCRPTGAIRRSTPTARSTASLELSADYLPVLDPVAPHHQPACQLTVRDPNTPPTSADHAAAVAVLGRAKRSGPARTTCTTRCSTRRAASGSRRRCARPTIPTFCKEGSTHPSAKLFPIASAGPPPRRVRSRRRRS